MRGVPLFASFVFAKIVAFCGPVLVAHFFSVEFYGLIESQINLATWVAIFLCAGVPAAIPGLIINDARLEIVPAALFFVVASLFGSIVLFFLVAFFGLSVNWVVFPLLVGFTVFQQVGAPVIKSLRRSVFSPWLENISLHLLLFAIALLSLVGEANTPNALGLVLFFEAILLSTLLAIVYRKNFVDSDYPRLMLVWRCGFERGRPMLVSALISLAAFNSGRVVIEQLFGAESAAPYAYLLRLAGINIVAYQLFTLLFFKNLYDHSVPIPVNRLVGFAGLLVAFAFAMFLVLRFGADIIMPATMSSKSAILFFPLIIVQVNLWAFSGILEARLNSFGLAGSYSRFGITGLFATFVLISGLHHSGLLSESIIIAVLTLLSLVFVGFQVWVLKKAESATAIYIMLVIALCLPLVLLFSGTPPNFIGT